MRQRSGMSLEDVMRVWCSLRASMVRRAVSPAHRVVAGAAQQGLDIRAGLHSGECERSGDKLTGLAVHIGARVAALALPGEVLVSRTVKDLVSGSGIEFDDRGEQALKGVPGAWRLYAVRG
jgi:class 3 adenylate cyclase